MNRFDYIFETVTSIPRLSLDPTVFQYFDNGLPPIFKDGVKAQILMDIENFRGIIPISSFFAVNGILLPDFARNTPIEVKVVVDNEAVDAVSTAELMCLIKKLNSRLAVGTTHPVEYSIAVDESEQRDAEAVYDIANEKWIKTPDILNPEISKILNNINETLDSVDLDTGKAQRDLVDLNEIKKQNSRIIRMIQQAIERQLNSVNIYLTQQAKETSFFNTKDLSGININFIVSTLKGMKTPDNVISKVYRKFYLQKLFNRLTKILDEKQAATPFKDVPAVKKAIEGIKK